MDSDTSEPFSDYGSDSGDSSTSEPCSDYGTDNLSFTSTAAAGHRLLLSRATEASHDSIPSLVAELESPKASVDSLRRAAMELRLLARHNPDMRIRIAACGAVRPLVALLSHADPLLQEHGVTALLNLSISDENKAIMIEAGVIRPLVRALKSAVSPAARENAACALLRLSQLDGAAAAAVGRAGAIPLLVSLIKTGGARGKKDAVTALYSLCDGARENGLRAVEAGAVFPLLDLMSDPESGMVDKAAGFCRGSLRHREAGRHPHPGGAGGGRDLAAKGDLYPLPPPNMRRQRRVPHHGCPRGRHPSPRRPLPVLLRTPEAQNQAPETDVAPRTATSSTILLPPSAELPDDGAQEQKISGGVYYDVKIIVDQE